MTPEQRAALREAAEREGNAAVLALLDECERLREGAEHACNALRALLPLIEALPGGSKLVATINEAIVLSAPRA